MIQDIYPHKLNNQYDIDAVPAADDFALYFEGSKVLLKKNDTGMELPLVSDFGENCTFTYLLSVDSLRFFMVNGTAVLPEGCEKIEVFVLRGNSALPRHLIYGVMTAKHLSDWYRDTRFCGRCGTAAVHSAKERARVCPSCGYTAYPRIMPAVIVGVKNGDKLLLTRYRTGYGHNALIAGFTEIGETLEETVAREVMEEAGVKVKNIRYYKSQPWGVANDILTGFYCEVDGDTQINMDSNELKMAQWVAREDIELQPDDFSLTNEMMMKFKIGEER